MPRLRVVYLSSNRAAKDAISYITDEGKALGQRFYNLPNDTKAAAMILEAERWRSGRDHSLLHLVLAFPDGADVDVRSGFAYLKALLDECGLGSHRGMAAAHAGRPHIHAIISRVDGRGRLASRIRDMVEVNRDLERRFAIGDTQARAQPLPAAVVNAETWEGELSFNRYLIGLPWPQAHKDVSRDVDVLLARLGIERLRSGQGWRLERRTKDGRIYRAKASTVIPKAVRELLREPEPTGIAVAPELAYETLRERGVLVLPEVHRHERFEEAQAAQERSAKGLGYWVRRLSRTPPTWTEEDRAPMYLLTRTESGWSAPPAIDDATRARFARELAENPRGFHEDGIIVAADPLTARVHAVINDDQHHKLFGGEGYAIALAGQIDAQLPIEWQDGPERRVLLINGRDYKIPFDKPGVKAQGPVLFLIGKDLTQLLDAALHAWARHERSELGARAEHRLGVVTGGIAPYEIAPPASELERDTISPSEDAPGPSLDGLFTARESDEPDTIAPAAPPIRTNGAAPNLTEAQGTLLGLWRTYLRGLGIGEERITALIDSQRDAIAARSATLESMHRLGATDIAHSLQAVDGLDSVTTEADVVLSLARAETGVPILSAAEFAFAPPEEFRDALRATIANDALGMQRHALPLGARALSFHRLLPAAEVLVPDFNDASGKGPRYKGFVVADDATRTMTTVLYDEERGYVFDRSKPSYADDALRYALLLAAAQDDGAVTMGGSNSFKGRVVQLAVELGITVTNDRGRIARLGNEAQERQARYPQARSEDGHERALAVARDLGIPTLDPATLEDQRLTVLRAGTLEMNGTVTLAHNSAGELVAVSVPIPAQSLGPETTLDITRVNGELHVEMQPVEERAEPKAREARPERTVFDGKGRPLCTRCGKPWTDSTNCGCGYHEKPGTKVRHERDSSEGERSPFDDDDRYERGRSTGRTIER